jgi:glycerophosphoryl diester phosphodiesterase
VSTARGRGPLILAHRGDHRAAGENSLAAMRAALAVPGCDGLEFDLRAAADGVPVLIHDATLERTHGRADRVGDLPSDALAPLGVPTFAAVLEAVPTDRFLDVELKEDVVAETARLLRPWLAVGGRAIVSSFSAEILGVARRLAPTLERWLNSETFDGSTIETARSLACTALSVQLPTIDAGKVAEATAAGLAVAAWTVTEPDDLRRLAGLGVVAVCVEGRALEDR